MFRIYREEGCLFECRLRNASSQTNCIPWDYPVPQGGNSIDMFAFLPQFGLKTNLSYHLKLPEWIHKLAQQYFSTEWHHRSRPKKQPQNSKEGPKPDTFYWIATKDLDGIAICLSWQNGTNNLEKFNSIMEDPEVVTTCNCLPDCEKITYETRVTRSTFKPFFHSAIQRGIH